MTGRRASHKVEGENEDERAEARAGVAVDSAVTTFELAAFAATACAVAGSKRRHRSNSHLCSRHSDRT